MQLGFDNEKYLQIQSQHIKERISRFGDKLYLEFGGKLFDDHHASRVLPGFQPDSKLKMLTQLRDVAEVVFVISAADIEKNKVRADLGITYDKDVLRLRDVFTSRGFMVSSVVITHFNGQSSASAFRKHLERMGVNVYYHYLIEGYPSNISLIASDEGFGKNEFVETTRPLVFITAPGPGSGKMAVCLSQLYGEHKRGVKAGYAKFETFPIWNLPLKHPINLAYEAATADLADVNMIDPFHLEAYGQTTVNYNRDIEIFPVLNALFEGIYGESPYKSPTDMGVNMIGFCISNDEVCSEASRQEIIRRYYNALCNFADGRDNATEVNTIKLLMGQMKLTTADRRCTVAAREALEEAQASTPSVQACGSEQESEPVIDGQADTSLSISAAAIELTDGTLITSHSSSLLGASAALLLNATKHLAGIPHHIKLISQEFIEPIQHTKTTLLHGRNPRLHTDEVLVALSVLSRQDENCARALAALPLLGGCQIHTTEILNEIDCKIFKKLGCSVTSDPVRK